MSTEGWPGPMPPSPTRSRTFAQMTKTEILRWANTAYRAQRAAFVTEIANAPSEVIARDFGIGNDLAKVMKSVFADMKDAS